jgi:hypothetical protein
MIQGLRRYAVLIHFWQTSAGVQGVRDAVQLADPEFGRWKGPSIFPSS